MQAQAGRIQEAIRLIDEGRGAQAAATLVVAQRYIGKSGARHLGLALQLLDTEPDRARTQLAALVGGRVVRLEPRDLVVATHARPATTPNASTPQTKQYRIEDRAAIAAYLAEHPVCEIASCGKPGRVHHIVPVSAQGDDVPENFVTLCDPHHLHGFPEGFHQLKALPWFKKFNAELPSEIVAKFNRIYHWWDA